MWDSCESDSYVQEEDRTIVVETRTISCATGDQYEPSKRIDILKRPSRPCMKDILICPSPLHILFAVRADDLPIQKDSNSGREVCVCSNDESSSFGYQIMFRVFGNHRMLSNGKNQKQEAKI